MSRTTTAKAGIGAPASGWAELRHAARALVETTKPGITRLVTITSIVGFICAAVGRAWMNTELALAFLGCVAGTALSASGANSLNQWWERERDARMARTMRRPLPREAVEPRTVLWAGLVLSVLGVGLLAAVTGWAPAVVSLACIVSYVLVYTPMKPLSPFSTLVGAIPGALPPLIGWTAGHPEEGFAALMGGGGLALFGLMFIWQLPHFLAIAWMYKDDYALGGHRVLPVIDPELKATAVAMLGTAVLQLPATLLPWLAMPERVGWLYGLTAVVTGLIYIRMSARLVKERTRAAAKRVFLASIMHLPVLLLVLVADVVLG